MPVTFLFLTHRTSHLTAETLQTQGRCVRKGRTPAVGEKQVPSHLLLFTDFPVTAKTRSRLSQQAPRPPVSPVPFGDSPGKSWHSHITGTSHLAIPTPIWGEPHLARASEKGCRPRFSPRASQTFPCSRSNNPWGREDHEAGPPLPKGKRGRESTDCFCFFWSRNGRGGRGHVGLSCGMVPHLPVSGSPKPVSQSAGQPFPPPFLFTISG